MSPIRFAMFAVLVLPPLADAGVVISLVPEPYSSNPTEPIRVEVFAQLDANSPPSVSVRGLQFNLSESSDALHLTTPIIYSDEFSFIWFWDFSSSSACTNDPDACGANYYVDGSLTDDDNLVIAYSSLSRNISNQIKLTQAAPTRVGVLYVQIMEWGVFDLDVLNADEPVFVNNGSWMAFGYGTSDSDPAITWSAYEGTITGGQLRFVIPEPATLALLLLGTAFLTTRRGAQASSTKAMKNCKIDSRVERVLR